MNKVKIHIIPSFHYDVAYTKTFRGYLKTSLGNIRAALRLLAEHPEYTYSLEQVILVREYWRRYPRDRSLLKRFAKEGRLIFAPGMFTMPDSNIPSGENFIRNALIGREWLKKHLGVGPDCCWMADIFGHNPQSPQLAKTCGYSSYMFERGKAGRWDATFKWKGIDGTVIDTHWEIDTYYGINLGLAWMKNRPEEWIKRRLYEAVINPLKKHSPCKNFLMSPLGGDFLKPLEDHIQFVRKWNRNEKNIKLIFSVPQKYFDGLKKKAAGLKTAADDFNPLCEGCYSTRIRIKQYNRRLEELAMALELLESAKESGRRHKNSESLWEVLAWNAFHDIICGSIVNDALKEALRDYERAERRAGDALKSEMRNRAGKVLAQGKDKALLAYNSLPYARTEIIPAGSGKFIKAGLPPAGFALINPADTKAGQQKTEGDVKTDGHNLENEYIRVRFGRNGTIISFYDKENKREFACRDNGMNNPCLQPDYGDPWSIGSGPINDSLLRTTSFYDPMPFPGGTITRAGRINLKAAEADSFAWPEPGIIHAGPLKAAVEFNYPEIGFSTQVSLGKGEKMVRFRSRFIPRGKKYRLRVAFPTNIKKGIIRHSVPCGHIERPEGEYAGQGWIDYRDIRKGLLLVNKGLPGNNVTDGVMMLSLFRAVAMERNEDHSWYEEGVEHIFEYGLTPFNPEDSSYNPSRTAACFNRPVFMLPVKNIDLSKGILENAPLIELAGDNAELACHKMTGAGLIIRLYETRGKRGTAVCKLKDKIKSCRRGDAAGKNLRRQAFSPREIKLRLKPFEITTLKVN